jgi:DNA adenine methylase
MPKKYPIIEDEVLNVVEDLFQPYNLGAKPFLKWAGGKGQLLQKFQELYPQELKKKKIKNYYEPFVGSGAVFFDIAQNFEIENAYLYDINDELILTYKVIQQDVSKLIDFLYRYQKTYLKLDKEQRDEYFYEQRINYNLQRFNLDYTKYSEAWIPRAAQLIFLNRTCFNGLYRVNSKGEFNTPVGDYDNPTICDEYNLLTVAKILELATIKKADFTQVKKDLKANSFVYFDPPYRPISKTASFTAYSKNEFGDKEQKQLATLFNFITNKGELAMLSNSDPKNNDPSDNFFDDLYKDYDLIRVPAKRMINSDPSKRGNINEIVVTNYSIKQWQKEQKEMLRAINLK